MRRPYAPDDSGMLPQDPVRRGNHGRNGNGNGYNAPGFFTGAETRKLAKGLADEFGGGVKSWRRDLNWQPKMFSFGRGHGRGHGNGSGRDGSGNNNNPGTDHASPNEPYHPHSRMALPQMPMQPQAGAMPMQPPVYPMQGQYMPQIGPGMLPPNQFPPRDRGLLGVPATQIPPQQQQGLLGDIPPEVLAYIRNRGMR